MKYLKFSPAAMALCILIPLITGCEKKSPEEDPVEDMEYVDFLFPSGSFRMIYCPGGTFLTNDDDGDTDFEDGPEVTCEPFWISETEVTNELLRWIYGSAAGSLAGTLVGNPFFFNSEDDNAHNYICDDYVRWGGQDLIYMGESFLGGEYDIYMNPGFNVRDGMNDYPCSDITWYGAVMACNWLTMEGLGLGTSRIVYSGIEEEWWDDATVMHENRLGFRLPTSNEWECAARWQGSDNSNGAYEYPAGSGSYWTKGGYASGAAALANNVDATSVVAVYEYDSATLPNPEDNEKVKGSRTPNTLGLYDMSGNVWEWCFDEGEGGSGRIMRGGSSQSKYHDVRISSTWHMGADGTGGDLGFRLVMSAEEK